MLHLPIVSRHSSYVVIAFQAFVLSRIRFVVEGRLPKRIRQYGEKVANLALIVIGLVLFVQKFTSHG